MFTKSELRMVVEDLKIENDFMVEGVSLSTDGDLLIEYMENVGVELFMEAANQSGAVAKGATDMTNTLVNTAKSVKSSCVSAIKSVSKKLKGKSLVMYKKAIELINKLYSSIVDHAGKIKSFIVSKYETLSKFISKTKTHFAKMITSLFSILKHTAKVVLGFVSTTSKSTAKSMYKPVTDGLKNGHYVAISFYIVGISALAFIGSYYIGKLVISTYRAFMNRIKEFASGLRSATPQKLKANSNKIKNYVSIVNKLKTKSIKAKKAKKK